jgi:hypothetical protein
MLVFMPHCPTEKWRSKLHVQLNSVHTVRSGCAAPQHKPPHPHHNPPPPSAGLLSYKYIQLLKYDIRTKIVSDEIDSMDINLVGA